MAKTSEQQNDNGNTISYPTDVMREVAQDILNAVQTARQQHNQHWGVINHYINSTCAPAYKPLGMAPNFLFFQGDVSSNMNNVLKPHATRLTSSYDWLETFATDLQRMATMIEQTEQSIKASF